MLFLVLVLFLASSATLVIINKNKRAFLMLALCLTFLFMYTGIIIYFAKTGGLTIEQRQFFFLDNRIQQWISYLNLSLPQIGYMIAIGRYLFPLILLLLTWEYNYSASIPKYKKFQIVTCICPLISLVIYYPTIFFKLFNVNSIMQKFLIIFMIVWIMIYIILSIILLLQEYFYTTIQFSKKSFRNIIIFFISVILVYISYAIQDPVQVYRMYSIQYSSFYARSYLSLISNIPVWYAITIMSVLLIGIGLWNIQKYSKLKFDEEKGELKLQKKFRDAHNTVPVFVHSIKNQILAEKVIEKRIRTVLESEEIDKNKLNTLVIQLEQMNQSMLMRIEELYRSVKTNYVDLIPTNSKEILNVADERFHQKYPDGKVDYLCQQECFILADKAYLGEAVANLLINAYEASFLKQQPKIECIVKPEKLYLLIHIRDNGVGMDSIKKKKIFDPFYTSKNTNVNWGMGLTYVMQIIKEHLGTIRVESIPGKGTDFYVYIPLYRKQMIK